MPTLAIQTIAVTLKKQKKYRKPPSQEPQKMEKKMGNTHKNNTKEPNTQDQHFQAMNNQIQIK